MLQTFEIFIISAVKSLIRQTIKNPKSAKAQQLGHYLGDLKDVVDDALAALTPTEGGK